MATGLQNAPQGAYFTGTQGLSLIKNNLRQLLLCEKGERIMLPDYGLSLKKYIFEPLDETTYFLMRTDILRTIDKYFKSVNVIKLAIYADELQRERNEILVSLTLQLLDESLEIFNVEVTIG
jgi:phage baseplate assembly protein W|tara:strand:+ start:17940 stop:18305 length:366 start_codon:yes stop_codon:yes gene_type:complete